MHKNHKILSNDELKKIICGAVYFDENDGIIPYRFSKETMDKAENPARQIRNVTGTGIKLDFYSDTEALSFNYTAFVKFVSSIYKLYFFDIYVDNVLVLHQGERNLCEDRSGTISIQFPPGQKRITIYLPGSCAVKITDFSITNGAKVSPVTYIGNALFLGDSITHAAYVDFPSLTYANIISKRLNYYTVNQAIGGGIFTKSHLENLPEMDFDVVFIAYGTNDWRWANADSPERIAAFFSALENLYTTADKYVLLPIWRADMNEAVDLTYSFDDVRKIIKDTASKYNLTVIDAFDLIPHDPRLYYDKHLHPNEMGFAYYADEIEKHLVQKKA